MYIASVIPIARGIPFDTLSYYASEALVPGTLVTVPLAKRSIMALVIESTPLSEAKALVKSATFSLKKIKQVHGTLSIFVHATRALATCATAALAPIGAIAGAVMPQYIFEYVHAEKLAIKQSSVETPTDTTSVAEHVVLGSFVERSDNYKRLIRSAFAKKESVVFVAPTIRALEEWQERLSKGIAKHVVIFHSKLSKKALRASFVQLKSPERPLLLFVTPGFLLLPRTDIGHIIAEDESSSLYKTSDRYAIDVRIFVRAFAESASLSLSWGDTLPRFQTLKRLDADHVPRAFLPDKLHIVPIEPYRTTLPTEVIETLRHAQAKKRRIYIYASRKGVAPLSRCNDCGTIVACPTCTLPMVLRNKVHSDGTRERYFICTQCATSLDATHVCSYCGSWNITPLAIGTESIYDEVAKVVGAEHVFVVDDDLTPDAAAVEAVIDRASALKFSVVIGTIKVLPYLRNIHYALFPFFDRLLSTPSLYTTETALRLVMESGLHVLSGVIICTRNPEFAFIRQLETQKINAIIHDELAVRRDLGYPPFGLIVKISLTVPEGHRSRVQDAVDHYFEGREATSLPARRIDRGSMKVLMVWILKCELTFIEDHGGELIEFLNSLRFPYKIEQNPERL